MPKRAITIVTGKKAYRAAKRRYANVARRFTIARMPRVKSKNFRLNTHHFSRFGAASTLEMTGTEQPLSFEFLFNQMYTYSEFTSLFDKYRLDKAEVYIQLMNNPSAQYELNTAATGGNGNYGTNWYPKMWWITDHDDSNTTTIAAIKERVGVKCCVLKPNVVKKIVVKPAVAVQIYRTATTTGYGPKWGQFIDMANTDVPHYGLKTVFDALGQDPGLTFKFRYEVKYYFTCKDVQ